MHPKNHLLTLLIVLLSFCPGVALARAGFAEWEIRTPGGLLISDTDSQPPAETPCLRNVGPDESRTLVRQLKRWRYYESHVVGESAHGYFVVNERTGNVQTPGSESEFDAALRRLGKTASPWMSPPDGWREAWFPYTVWRPCRLLAGGPGEAEALGFTPEEAAVLRGSSSAFPSADECRASMASEWIELYRRTTWGRQCRQLGDSNRLDSPEHSWLKVFCANLLDGS